MKDFAFLKEVARLAGTQRDITFVKACEAAIVRQPKSIVETGCYRGVPQDGQSDLILSLLAKHISATFDAVDISQDSIDKALLLAGRIGGGNYHRMCSVEYLKKRKDPIGFLYLDSMDFYENNPDPSQAHQLEEIKAALPLLTKDAIVLLDDSLLPHGGKAKLSSVFLSENGFKLEFDSYQRLYLR